MENSKLVRNGVNVQVILPIEFLKIITQSNKWISALNTNVHVHLYDFGGCRYSLYIGSTVYLNRENAPDQAGYISSCERVKAVAASGFYSASYHTLTYEADNWPQQVFQLGNVKASALVDGFFSGCTPLDGLLASTLDCLYNATCLERLAEYFPGLRQVRM